MNGMDVVSQARTWLGTPYAHQGRAKGIGVDCAGLVIMVARELGLSDFDTTGYGRTPDADTLRGLCEALMVRVEEAEPGDVLLMRFTREPQHLGFRSDLGLVHAYARAGAVVETSYDRTWQKRTVAAYRLRGVA